MNILDFSTTHSEVVDEIINVSDSNPVHLAHDIFYHKSGKFVRIFTAASEGGTELTAGTDFDVGGVFPDGSLPQSISPDVAYTTVEITNATYHDQDLYVHYYPIGDIISATRWNHLLPISAGHKQGLEIFYAGADDIRVHPGVVHVYDSSDTSHHFVYKDAETALSGESSITTWVAILIDKNGNITQETMTGASSEPPTNAYFQWANFNHSAQGYYESAGKRVIGAIWRVDDTTWYIINMGKGREETGENSNGHWRVESSGLQVCWAQDSESGVDINNVSTTGGYFADLSSVTFPKGFDSAPIVLCHDTRGAFVQVSGFEDISASAFVPRARAIDSVADRTVRFSYIARGKAG